MYIVPIIADGRLVKSHTEYVITNKQWQLMNNGLGLWDYLTTLQLMESPYPLMNFAGIRDFYLRVRYRSDIITKVDIAKDPWGRKFIVMPPATSASDVYKYYSYSNVNLDVDVIVTTVNRSKVYCVDVIKY